MNLFGILDISASALTAERQRAEVVTSNLANANTSGTKTTAYRRQEVVFSAEPVTFQSEMDAADQAARGVGVTEVIADSRKPQRRYDPSNPQADKQGFVYYPNINPVEEMTDLMDSVRSYEFNLSAIQATKSMIQQSIQLLR